VPATPAPAQPANEAIPKVLNHPLESKDAIARRAPASGVEEEEMGEQ
jgi:hypothetical protein